MGKIRHDMVCNCLPRSMQTFYDSRTQMFCLEAFSSEVLCSEKKFHVASFPLLRYTKNSTTFRTFRYTIFVQSKVRALNRLLSKPE